LFALEQVELQSSREPSATHKSFSDLGRLPQIALRDAVLLLILSLVVRLIQVDHTPFYDELYHVLSAQSWLQHGRLSIAEGEPYTRGALFTYLVAGLFKVFGSTLVVARIPSVLAGSLCVAAVYLWTCWAAGRMAGWIAALLLCFSPQAIFLSELARFYTLQTLSFWIGAAGVYLLLTKTYSIGVKLAITVVSGLAIATAWYFQATTAIGCAGLAVWVGIQIAPRVVRQAFQSRRTRWIIATIIVGLVTVSIAAIYGGWVSRLLETFRSTTLWNAQDKNNFAFYQSWLLELYPSLWTLVPLAAAFGLAHRRDATSLCLSVFGISFVLHSLAGPKADRYISYAIPFFFALWGIAVAAVIPYILKQINSAISQIIESHGRFLHLLLRWAWPAGIVCFLLATNPAFPLTYRMLSVNDANWIGATNYRGQPDWAAVASILKPLSSRAEINLMSVSVKGLYFLGRSDIEISRNHLFDETGVAREFSQDPRIGRPVISTPESLRLVMNRYSSGLVVVEEVDWRNPAGVPAATAEFLENHAQLVGLPKRTRLLAFTWHNAPASAADAAVRDR
jgi:4-amino-4-deoxy-L-arabinose transferase-like glycosyltransferase